MELRSTLHWFASVYFCFAAGLDGLKRSTSWTHNHYTATFHTVHWEPWTITWILSFWIYNSVMFVHSRCMGDMFSKCWKVNSQPFILLNVSKLNANDIFTVTFYANCLISWVLGPWVGIPLYVVWIWLVAAKAFLMRKRLWRSAFKVFKCLID